MFRKRLKAFLLVEALVALCIIALIFALTAEAGSLVHLHYRQKADYVIAEARAENVLSILKYPAFYCGIGMPSAAAEYKYAFGGKTSAPFNWNGPLSMKDSTDGRKDAVLRLAYGHPDTVRVTKTAEAGDYAADIHFDKAPNADYLALGYFNPSSFLKNWLLVADSQHRIPFYATSLSGKKLTVKNYSSKTLSLDKRGRLLLLRAFEAHAQNDIFYTNDFRTSGVQPREKGICDARFVRSGSALKVFLLIRGDDAMLSASHIVPGAGAEEWPAAYSEKLSTCRHRHYSFIYTLPLQNYDRADTPEQQS